MSESKLFVTFTAPKDLPEVHRCLINLAVDSLNEYCIGEEVEELEEALRCLRVLKVYVTPTVTSMAP